MHVPGDIILVADNDYAGTQIGGRVLSVEQNTVTIDREAQFKVGDKFMFYNQAAEVVSVKVAEVLAGNKLRMEVPPAGLTEHGVWLRHGDKIQPQLYRALSIKEDHKGKYTITAIQHEPQKEAIVDNGAHFEPVSFSETPERYRIQNVDVAVTDGGVKLTFDYFAKNESTVKYQVKLYRTFDGKTSLYKVYDDLTTTSITFAGLPNGSYTAEIRAKNGVGQLSDPVTRTFEINLDIKRFVTKSLLFAIELDWDLPKTASVGDYTEVWLSTTNDISKAVKVATLPYPQNNYVMSGVPLSAEYYFWLRCGDKNDNKGEFTAAVFGEADHNPDNLLNAIEGKITKSHLGQELINSLKNDVDSAVSEEAKARTAAVNNALQQINNQAATTGTAIQKLEKADKAQAETIKTVTAKAESALSGITAVRQAQANSDKANAQQITALTARMGTAESSIANIRTAKADKSEVAGIAQQSLRATWQADAQAKADKAKTDAVAQSKAEIDVVSRAVAGVNSKLLATHTIKTQVVAGGRTAIAGIALGASSDGKTAESSVIVMADKFGIVANANDSNVKQVFSVANGQVGIRGDLVVAGSVTRDKLSSGGGGNLLDNPIFANNAYGWGENRGNGALTGQTTSLVRRMSNKFSGLVTNSSVMIAEVRANSAVSSWWQIATQTVSVDPGRRYCFSAYMDAWACTGELMIQEIAGDGKSWVRDFAFSGRKGRSVAGYSQSGALEEGDGSIQSSARSHVFFTAPSTGYISVVCIMRDIQKASVLKVAMPMLEECTEHATEPSPWQNAGLTEVHGGSIIANTIRGDHIQANQEIRSPRISGGEIDISGNDGILRVGRTGNFLVRASSQDRGLVMNNDQIIVYDERGNVRVKIGKLM